MSTETIIRHCAPTLAGLKVGNLVSCEFFDFASFSEDIRSRNTALNGKGIFFVILKVNKNTALVYVYRETQLNLILKDSNIVSFLKNKGYNSFTIEGALASLAKQLSQTDFPHEIGVFLGYPLDDIIGFIENDGKNYKCVGCYKAYTNEEIALQTFRKFKKCTSVYCKRFAEGFDINRLTVAS